MTQDVNNCVLQSGDIPLLEMFSFTDQNNELLNQRANLESHAVRSVISKTCVSTNISRPFQLNAVFYDTVLFRFCRTLATDQQLQTQPFLLIYIACVVDSRVIVELELERNVTRGEVDSTVSTPRAWSRSRAPIQLAPYYYSSENNFTNISVWNGWYQLDMCCMGIIKPFSVLFKCFEPKAFY